MSTIPLFAIIGHPNEGKSSVVATLAEDDSVRISATPGETTRIERFDLRAGDQTILEFVDTPGFQNPNAALAWFQANRELGGEVVTRFIAAHQADPDFHHDCELMRPLVEGAGIIYIVDGSRPISAVDHAEMEILRLTGRPRMAVINSKTGDEQFLESWKAAFRMTFNAVRVFNACAADFTERIGLLEALKSIDQDSGARLESAVDLLRKDRTRRLSRVAESIAEMIEQATTFSESKLVARESDLDGSKPSLEKAYRSGLSAIERRAWTEILRQFKHRRLSIELPDTSILQEDLFSDRTWQAFGLTGKQLAWTAAAAGAGIGAGLDVMAGGIAFGVFTLAGAALSGGAALLKGKELAKMKVNRIPVGGFKLQIGPNQNEQFPFILLDRALLFARHAQNRAHARQDHALSLTDADLKAGPCSSLSPEERALCMKFFVAIRKSKRDVIETLYPEFKALLTRLVETQPSDPINP